jgi:serine/threonine-protein kinase
MAAPLPVDGKTFLGYLRQSRLLTEEQITGFLGRLAGTDRGRVIARALVDAGLLTRFQAERLLAGRTSFFLGPYRILEQLGRGGMGRVFKAEHGTMKRLVALKVLAPALLKTERARELFAREVQASARIVHPNVVTAYDATIEESCSFLVLEYIDGPSLEQLVRKGGPVAVGLACDYIRQACSGLHCAFQMGMLHRDIKPANILVQRRGLDAGAPGLIKISDFGLARLHAPDSSDAAHAGTILTRDNTVMGTPDYLSPEQARNLHKTDIRSDLYSLGCTFYFLLSGRVPFPGGTPIEKLLRHSAEKPTPIATLRADLPPAVAAIVECLLAKHPDDRYQTPAELAEALAPFAVSGPTPWDGGSVTNEPAEGAATPTGDLATDVTSRLDLGSSEELPVLVLKPAAPTPAPATTPLPPTTVPIPPAPRPVQESPEEVPEPTPWKAPLAVLGYLAVIVGLLLLLAIVLMMALS